MTLKEGRCLAVVSCRIDVLDCQSGMCVRLVTAPEHMQPSSAGLAPALKLLLGKQPDPGDPEDSGDDEWDH